MREPHYLDVLVAGLVDAADYRDHTIHVGGTIRNNEHVRTRVCSEVSVLWNQRPQNRYELRSAHIFDLNNLCNDVVCTGRTQCTNRACVLPRSCIRHNLDEIARGNGDVTMHLQD